MPQRIPSHKPPRLAGRPRRDDSKRPNAAARGYCDKAHRAWRQAVLTRDAWQCQACGRVCGDPREAHADHVIPVSQGGERYSLSNGQCLCVSCHGRKTRGEQVAAAGKAAPPPRRDDHTDLREVDPNGSSFVAARDKP
jgi:5-methylcytosine-specific restriction protein A